MEGFLTTIRLRLFHFDCLRRRLHLDPIEMYEKVVNLFQALGTFDINRIDQRLNMNCHLEMVLFLAHKSIVRVAKIETFVRVHPVAKLSSIKGNLEKIY